MYRDVDGKLVKDMELTHAIRSDDRIPENAREITLEHLPVFKEWQERLDKEIRS